MRKNRQDDKLRCSFCGKAHDEVKQLIAGPTVYICNECNDIVNEILDDKTIQQIPEKVAALRILTYQYATQTLSGKERSSIEEKIHETADVIRSKRRERSGDVVAQYQLTRVIGCGNFATVWEGINSDAQDDRPERAAIKIFDISKLTIGLMLWRFNRGIRAMQHLVKMSKLAPNSVVRIFDVSQDSLAFSMQYLPGGDLQNIGRLGWSHKKRMDVFKEVCFAVRFAHSQGIIHRDIKPANIVLTAENSPVLTDFDIAEIKFAATESVRSGSLGTPQFAAPEQLIDKNLEASPTADIYSLGKLLYYIITEEAPPLGSTEPGYDPAYLKKLENVKLRELIKLAIQHDPSSRLQTVEEVLMMVEDCKKENPFSKPSSITRWTQPTPDNDAATESLSTMKREDKNNQNIIADLAVRSDFSKWAPLAGTVFGAGSLVFFMLLVVFGLMGYSIPADDRFLVIIVLSLGVSLSISLLGGSAAANGTIPIPFAQEHPLQFSLSGAIAAFILTMIIGYTLYVR